MRSITLRIKLPPKEIETAEELTANANKSCQKTTVLSTTYGFRNCHLLGPRAQTAFNRKCFLNSRLSNEP